MAKIDAWREVPYPGSVLAMGGICAGDRNGDWMTLKEGQGMVSETVLCFEISWRAVLQNG